MIYSISTFTRYTYYFVRYKNKKAVGGASAFVGLAPPGAAGSWQLENKVFRSLVGEINEIKAKLVLCYQFWTKTDKNGKFLIKNVVPGAYSLFASVPGTVGDYKRDSDIRIDSGSNVDVRDVVFDAPRKGPTLWEMFRRTSLKFWKHPSIHPMYF